MHIIIMYISLYLLVTIFVSVWMSIFVLTHSAMPAASTEKCKFPYWIFFAGKFALAFCICLLSLVKYSYIVFYYRQIGCINCYPLFSVRSWNNGMRSMSLYILLPWVAHTSWLSNIYSVFPVLQAVFFRRLNSVIFANSTHGVKFEFVIKSAPSQPQRILFVSIFHTVCTFIKTNFAIGSRVANTHTTV